MLMKNFHSVLKTNSSDDKIHCNAKIKKPGLAMESPAFGECVRDLGEG